MKEVLSFYAEYNKKANAALVGILTGLSPELMQKDMGTFFKSVLGTLNHSITAELLWLKRFNDFTPSPALRVSTFLAMEMDDVHRECSIDASCAFVTKIALDDLLMAYVGDVREEDLTRRFTYKSLKGIDMERTLWHMLMHVVNHETHHRGVISAMLDILKVNNDYSNILSYVD